LRDSIDSQHLVLHYQPLIEIATGRVVKVEALLRWRRGSGNLLMPGDILPLVEASEVNDRIARWVIETAIRDCHESGGADMGVGMSVNISPHNLRDAELPKVLAELLQRYSYPPGNFTIEITESGILSEAVLAAGVFQRLRDIGVGLSIDDFGTGYSSLMHLKHLPFTELKVDRSFTHDMLVNPHDAAIVRSTIDLGHELGRTIVAEGVETPETLERLRQYRCDYAQGYFISPPLDKVAMREWMVQRDWGKTP
jgi:EAL domain-containing protein (putative c-di-GMP-specific phosphodiesterase class I)